MTTIKQAFSNAIAAAGQDLLTALAIEVQAEEINIEDVIRSLEIRGEPFPHSLTSADPLTILLALEQSGDWSFTS